jgi:hypothetical protein
MNRWVETLKPAASRRAHLLLAAMLWTVVGGLLLYFGGRWVLRSPAAWPWLQLLLAAGVGAFKTWLVLDRTAGRIVERIRARGDGRCIGGFVPLKTYLLIGLMAAAGRLLRGGLVSEHVIGLIYAAVGAALLFGARNFWRAWYMERKLSAVRD